MAAAPGTEGHRRHFAAFAAAAYDRTREVPSGFVMDTELSNRNRAVWYNPESRQVVFAERGTQLTKKSGAADLGTDALLALDVAQYGSRFRNSLRTAKKVRDKYLGYDFTATGHSLGGSAAQYVHNRLGVNAVTYSAHLPTNQIGQEALKTALGKQRQRNAYNYTTLTDPIGVGMAIAGKSYVIEQTDKSPHALANFTR